ncbi:hypothetical protein Tdes44962_MAKER06889 [Teratosphaeria destructans]|uniref:Gfd2/YDR514C-like C-terminal domain-containing protein n=1 Tax=Teratosphaeria destructans TaxID=418781 RepID=A0A9W7T0M2_9PEZI|nr:hypothetical protein Tdes44962_MAKER06889 [Teratosphaeria destructans]
MATPALDRLISLIGGEQNLPPKRDPSPPPAPSSPQPAQNELSSVEQYMADNPVEDLPSHLQPKQKQKAPAPSAQPTILQTAQPLPPPLTEGQRQYDERCGEPAPAGMKFAPFMAITKFPYKYVSHEWRQPLASAFFDEKKIYNRAWDMYYVYNGYFPTSKPTTFVPLQQFETLLAEINDKFPDAKIELDDKAREELIYDFDLVGPLSKELRPRFLGHSTQHEQIAHWVDNLPFPGHVTISSSMQNDDAYKSFIQRMDSAIDAGKNKKSNKKRGKSNRIEGLFRHSGGETSTLIASAQRYLGLKPEEDSLDAGVAKLNLDSVTPSSHKSEPIFIAIDCEAYEEGAHVVTEVGVATLDTRDLKNMPPGPLGENWRQYIRARHFRITERTHMVNKKWVDGCPDKFQFGTSEFVSKDTIASALTSCFHPPFSARPRGGASEDGDDEVVAEKVEGPRNIIVLGHDLKQDIDYCHDIGFAVLNRGNLLDTMDTARMYMSYKRDVNPTSLPKVLHNFDISAWHAHNGGNDAVYTIYAMLAICAEAAETSEMGATKGGAAEVGVGAEEVKPVFGPERPPPPGSGLYTTGGVELDV